MNATLFTDIMALIVEQGQSKSDYLRLVDEACGGRPLYATHGGRLFSLSTLTRISMPHDPKLIAPCDTVFTGAGFRYTYPSDLVIPDEYTRLDASLLSATFCGEEDPATARLLAEASDDKEDLLNAEANGMKCVYRCQQPKGSYYACDPTTLLILGRVREAVRKAGEDDTTRMYTQPYRSALLVTLAVGDIWLQFMPGPGDEKSLGDYSRFYID